MFGEVTSPARERKLQRSGSTGFIRPALCSGDVAQHDRVGAKDVRLGRSPSDLSVLYGAYRLFPNIRHEKITLRSTAEKLKQRPNACFPLIRLGERKSFGIIEIHNFDLSALATRHSQNERSHQMTMVEELKELKTMLDQALIDQDEHTRLRANVMRRATESFYNFPFRRPAKPVRKEVIFRDPHIGTIERVTQAAQEWLDRANASSQGGRP